MTDDSRETSAAPLTDRLMLSVLERVLILPILAAAAGNMVHLRIVRNEQERIGFTDEEIQALQFKPRPGGGTGWTHDAVPDRPFGMSVTGRALVADALAKMEEDETLTLEHMSLYDKFVGAEESEDAQEDLKAVG